MQQHPIDLATSGLEQAKGDLDSARYLFDGSRYDATCFGSQQAAEKALTAVLVWLAGDRPRTHDLTILVTEISSIRSVLHDDALSRCIGGGIPGSNFFTPEARLALERADRAVAFAERLFANARNS